MRYNTFITLLLLLLFQQVAEAQNHLRFDRITVEDGLSTATVHAFFQTQKGLMWIGTEDGINVFNGYSFRIYKHDAQDSTSLSNNVVKTIFQDSKGTIWIGTENGLNRYLPISNSFQRFHADPKNKAGLTGNHIRKIVEDKKGHLWLATDNGVTKIVNYDEKNIECVSYSYEEDGTGKLGHPIVRGLFIDSKERVWIGTDGGGVYKVINTSSSGKTSKNEKIIHYDHRPNDVNAITSNRVNAFAEDIYGNIWISTWNGGLNKLYIDNNGEERIVAYPKSDKSSKGPNHNKLTTVFTDSKGYVWMGTYNAGINRAKVSKSSNDLEFESYISQKDIPTTLSHNTAYSFFEDKSGDIWVGTWGNGISRMSANHNEILHFGHRTDFSNKVFEEVYSIDFDNQNNWWIGSWDGGLARVKNKSGNNPLTYNKEIEYFKHNPKDPSSISDNKVTYVLNDSKDRLWVATWGEFLNVAFNVSATRKPVFNKIKVGDNAYFIKEDSRGKIWVGTQKGLYQIHGTEQDNFSVRAVDLSVYKAEQGNNRSLPGSRVRSMLIDNRDNVWIGTVGGGVAVTKLNTFDDISNASEVMFDVYQHNDKDNSTISSNNVQTMMQATNGSIWLGTLDGLDRYDEASNSFEHFNIETGHLINNSINSILEDDNGTLWISTDRGITQFNPQTGVTRHLGEFDGLQGDTYIPLSASKDLEGNLYFGGLYGLNAFNPNDVKPNDFVPPVVLTDFKILNESVKVSHHDCLKGGAFNELAEITVRYYEDMLTFEFAALNYKDTEHNQYQYKLEGFDKKWIENKEKREATYTNLDPGTYTFLVKGSNDDGLWNEEPLAITLRVLPPFWQTWWFRLLVVATLGFSIFWFVRTRIKAAEKRNTELELLVQERTKEIKKQKQLVEERSQYKEQFFSRVSHELRTPLNGIIGLSHLMERTDLSDVQHQFSNVIKDSAENLLVIVNDLLDISRINAGKLELQNRPFETSRFFNSLYELLRPKADQKNIDLEFQIDPELPDYITGDSVRLYQILVNLLGNALKFTIEGAVFLMVNVEKQEGDQLEIKLEVVDTGIGIPKEKLDNIFESYEQVVDSHGYHYEGSGLGLTIVKNLVDLQSGTIAVQSYPEEGTIFRVHLPFSIPSSEDIQKSIQQKEKTDFAHKWKDKELLLIEDNSVNLLYQKNLFIQWSLNVSVAKSVTEAIKLLSMARFDVIISDVKLPDGNGIDLIRTLQKDTRHVNNSTPVIILSASTSLSGARPKNIEVVSYMTKPFMPERLAEELNKIFKSTEIEALSIADDDHTPSPASTHGYLSHLYQMMQGNKKHIVTMVDVFLKQLPDSIENIDNAIIEEDWKKVNYLAHHAKSTIQTIGLESLATDARAIEMASEQQNPNLIYILDLFEQFKQRCTKEIPRLREEIEHLRE